LRVLSLLEGGDGSEVDDDDSEEASAEAWAEALSCFRHLDELHLAVWGCAGVARGFALLNAEAANGGDGASPVSPLRRKVRASDGRVVLRQPPQLKRLRVCDSTCDEAFLSAVAGTAFATSTLVDVALSGLATAVAPAACRVHLARLSLCTTLSVARSRHFDDDALAAVLRAMPQLRSLDVRATAVSFARETPFALETGEQPKVGSTTFSDDDEDAAPATRSVLLSHLNLRVLDASQCPELLPHHLALMARICPSLRQLDVSGGGGATWGDVEAWVAATFGQHLESAPHMLSGDHQEGNADDDLTIGVPVFASLRHVVLAADTRLSRVEHQARRGAIAACTGATDEAATALRRFDATVARLATERVVFHF
jgi:hypothetical protein